jgi:tRNA1Val (adenine37-N6)-methyltransferase
MSDFFLFKQFAVDQADCAMKINTDGVLLGALVEAQDPGHILDIGTGTGAVALMLAQRFKEAQVQAVEIDEPAAQTATVNFYNSPFTSRMNCFSGSFEAYFNLHPESKYDLIVSNPPFFIDSLKNPDLAKSTARHTDEGFFEGLIKLSAAHLTPVGLFWLIVPEAILNLIISIAKEVRLKPARVINIKSFGGSAPHRFLVSLSKAQNNSSGFDFVIYEQEKIYSQQYRDLLTPFFTIF